MEWFCVCFIYLIHLNFCSSVKYGPRFKDQSRGSPSARCDDFSKFARFQPYSVLDEPWKIFFHWGSRPAAMEYKFRVPSARDTSRLHAILDDNVEVPVDWAARQLIIRDSNNKTSLLVENNDRGQYLMYRVYAGKKKTDEKILHMDIRLKQKSGYIGIMFCNNTNAYVLARKSAVPRRVKIPDAVATMGIRMRGGMSYLYQGHHWMPVGEADDEKYFMGDDADAVADVNELVVPKQVEHEETGDMYESEEDDEPVGLKYSGKEEL